MVGEKELQPDACVHLKVVGVADRLGLRGAYSYSYAAGLRKREAGPRTTYPAQQLQFDAFLVYRRDDAVEIIKSLAVLQRAVVLPGRLKADFCPEAVTFREHHISTETQEEAVKRRCRLAVHVSRIRDTRAEGVNGIRIVDTGPAGPDTGGSEAHVEIE